ncbi:MAG: transcription antitermination factor NusB [Candidatus Magnetomorum sp.]|nr:transcription antitermination factor NusB [Candidatus Magnetomorum sp.]
MSIERRRHLRELSLQVLFFIDSVQPEIFGKPKRPVPTKNDSEPHLPQEESEPRSKVVRKGVRKRIANAKPVFETVSSEQPDHSQKLSDSERLELGNQLLDDFWHNFKDSNQGRDFFLLLTRGVIQHISEIDKNIETFSSNWKIDRMTCVDRNIIRIGVFEILRCPDIPYKVSINEAVDIGKTFGTNDSGSFINGVLDSIRISIETSPSNYNEKRINS